MEGDDIVDITKPVRLMLPCKLTEAERLQRGEECSRKLEEHDRVKDKAKDAAADYKRQVESLGTEARVFAKAAETGTEHREVECVWSPDPKGRRMELRRVESGELVRARPMTEAEVEEWAQASLFRGGAPAH